mgnify:CR=1 FL=1
MRIYPAIHYTMGGLWVDYNLMSNVPGLHVLGEANFSDHGANRLGASALMQGLADGYFVIPYTIGDYLASSTLPKVTTDHDAFKEAADNVQKQIDSAAVGQGQPRRSARFTASSAQIMWDDVGMARNEAEPAARARSDSASCATSSGSNVSVPGTPDNLNQSLEYAGRVADYLEFAELLALDALHRQRVVRRPLPRGEPDARRRGAARRRALYRTWPRGSSTASASSPSCTRSRSRSRKCIRRSGVTSNGLGSGLRQVSVGAQPARNPDERSAVRIMKLNLKIWRQAGPTAAGQPRRLRRGPRLARHVVSRDARRRQRRADRRAARTRSRSTPTAAKASAACAASSSTASPHGPDRGTTVCQLHMRRFKDGDTITDRALARQGLSRREGSRRRPQRVRSHHRRGRLRARSTCGGAPDGNAIPIPKDVVETRDGLGRVHRLRRLRRGLQERVGAPVHEREDLAPGAAAAGPASSATAASCAMIEQADAEGFGSCPTKANASGARREISISNIARMTREYARAPSRPAPTMSRY